MRILFIAVAFALMPCLVLAGEISLNLNQAVIISPSPESTSIYGAVTAISFSISDTLDSVKVVYAELYVPLDFSNITIGSDSILRISARPINHEWDSQTSWSNPWTDPSADLDTMSLFNYTLTMGEIDKENIYLDITTYLNGVLDGSRINHGLMLMPITYGESVYQLPQAIVDQFLEKGRIRVVYQ